MKLWMRQFIHWLILFSTGVPLWVLARFIGVPFWAAMTVTVLVVMVWEFLQPYEEEGRVTLRWPQVKEAWRDYRSNKS